MSSDPASHNPRWVRVETFLDLPEFLHRDEARRHVVSRVSGRQELPRTLANTDNETAKERNAHLAILMSFSKHFSVKKTIDGYEAFCITYTKGKGCPRVYLGQTEESALANLMVQLCDEKSDVRRTLAVCPGPNYSY